MGIGDEYTLESVDGGELVEYEPEADPYHTDLVAPVERYAQEAQASLERGDADTAFLKSVERYLHVGSGAVDDFRCIIVETYEEEGVDLLVASEELQGAVRRHEARRTVDFFALVENAKEAAEATGG